MNFKIDQDSRRFLIFLKISSLRETPLRSSRSHDFKYIFAVFA